MTKEELKEKLESGAKLVDLFEFTDGQECLIYKAKEFEPTDDIIYIPDTDLNGIETDAVLTDKEIDEVIHHCCTGKDFMLECNESEKLARDLFWFCDWQHPNVQDISDLYEDEDEFIEKYGFPIDDLFISREEYYGK